jgi:flagellar basal body-associated protein FliL
MDTSKIKLNKLGIIAMVSVVMVLVLAVGTSIYFYSKANANNIDPAKTKTLELKKSSVKKAPTSAETDFDAFTNLLKRPGVDTGRQDNLPHL